jgi:predicted esterase
MAGRQVSRRQFARAFVTALGAAGASCQGRPVGSRAHTLTARPTATQTTASPGMHRLGREGMRGGVLYVPPATARPPLPLLVLLHGAGGDGAGMLEWLESLADVLPMVILAPDSIERTWDAILLEQRDLFDLVGGTTRARGFGPDVASLDRMLADVFASVAIDPGRVVVGGFSDGATYALSLGLANGDLFHRIVAFSPGFIVDGERRGQPEIFITHGRADQILPIDRCSRRIVPQLRGDGYAVTYHEFTGGHELPEVLTNDALTWAAR